MAEAIISFLETKKIPFEKKKSQKKETTVYLCCFATLRSPNVQSGRACFATLTSPNVQSGRAAALAEWRVDQCSKHVRDSG